MTHDRKVEVAWTWTRWVLVVAAVVTLVGFLVSQRQGDVAVCRDRAERTEDAIERAKVMRAFLDYAADAREVEARRVSDPVLVASNTATAGFYRDLLRRSTVPEPIDCPGFWG